MQQPGWGIARNGLGGVIRLAAGLAAAVSTRGAELVFQTDFGDAPVQVDHPATDARPGAFSGVLPTGWRDDFSGWNSSRAESQRIVEGDRTYLRLTAVQLADGPPQFAANLPPLVDGGYYRMSLRARNRSGGTFRVGLRMLPPPYGFRFERRLPTAPEWVELTWCFRLEHATPEPLGIFLLMGGTGAVDLDRLRLERLTDAEMAVTIRRPETTLRNFFRNSRLPLGLQAGWNLDRDSGDATAEADEACIGPSGAPALRLRTTRPTTLYSEPFQVADPFVRNRAALAFRGTGEWRIGIFQEGRQIASKRIEPRAEWQRESIAFAPDFAARAFALAVTGHGTLWVDAFGAWSGDEDRPYASAGACEVALTLPNSEISETRIQFADEPARVRYRVTGDSAGATLRSRVVNIHGAARDLPDIQLDAETLAGTLAFDVFPDAPYGAFRIEAVVLRDGQRVSPPNELVVTRLQRPMHWGRDAPDSPFGSHFIAVDRTIRMLKAGGINWARLHDAGFEYTGWFWLEPERGQWAFRDAEIRRYRANHIRIFAQLGTAPKWASYLSRVETGRAWIAYHDRYFQPLSLDDFANYVRTVVERYRGEIDSYFVWNEPWVPAWWGVAYDRNAPEGARYRTSAEPQADYAALMKTAYQAAKAVDPSVRVAGFNTTGGRRGREWTRGVYAAGGLAFCDVIDYHFYTPDPQGFPGDLSERVFADATGYVREREGRLDKPVYMSEGQGTSAGEVSSASRTHAGTGIYHYALPFEPDEDALQVANLTAKYLLSVLATGAEKVFLYTAHGYQSLAAPNAFMVLLGGDGYPHPSLAAHSAFARHVEGRRFARTVAFAPGVYAHLFVGGGQTVAVVSGRPGGAAPIPRIAGTAIADLFGNPLPPETEYTGRLLYIVSERPLEDLTNALRPRD